MRATIFLAVGALCVIRAETGKLESEVAGVPSMYNLISASVGSRHKRQMQGRPGGGMCSDEEQTRRLTAVVCTPATGQRIIDVNLECNLESVARGLVQSCSTNENQRFCYESASNYTNSVVANCPRLSTYSGYQCTNSCRDALQNLKLYDGCCLNTRYYHSLATFSNFLDAGLWSACSISLPGLCTNSSLTLGSVMSRDCSSAYLNEQTITQIYCSAEVFKPYIDVFQQCGNSYYYEYYINLCRVNENNEFCYRIAPNITNYPQAVESQCNLDFTQGCTQTCHTALNTFKTRVGCCVKYFNATVSGLTFPKATNPALWSACGISFPKSCQSTLLSESTNQSSGPTARPVATTPSESANHTSASTTNQPALSDIIAAIIGGVVAVIVVVAMTVIIMVITAFVVKSHRARFSCHQDARREAAKLGPAALSGVDEITTTQCEAYEIAKLGYDYEDLSGYQNTEYEIPVTQCSAYGLTSKSGQ